MQAELDRVNIRGFACGLISALAFALMGFFVHDSSGKLSGSLLLYYRSLFGLLIFFPIIYKEIPILFTARAKMIWVRSIAGALSMSCFFWTVQRTTIGNARVLTNLAPVFILFLAWKFLNERVTKRELLGILIVVLAALNLNRDQSSSISKSVFFVGTLGSGFMSLAYFSLRKTSQKYTHNLIIWSLSVAMLVTAMAAGKSFFFLFDLNQVAPILGVAVCGIIGQVFLTKSFAYLRAPIASTLGLTQLVWGVLFEVTLHKHYPSPNEWASYFFVIVGVILLQLKKRH